MTTVVSFMVPCGVVSVPLLLFLRKRTGLVCLLCATTLLGATVGALQMVPSSACQVAAAAVFVVFRGFFYSVTADTNLEIFGSKSLGRVQGTMCSIAGLCSLALWPAVTLCLDRALLQLLALRAIVCSAAPLALTAYAWDTRGDVRVARETLSGSSL